MQHWYSDLWSIVSGSSKRWNIVHIYSKEQSFSDFPFKSNVHLLQKPTHHPFKFINQLQHMWAKLFKGDGFSAPSVMKRLYLGHLLTAEQATATFCLLSSPDVVISVSGNIWENKLTSSIFHPSHIVLPYQLFLLLRDSADHNGFSACISQ